MSERPRRSQWPAGGLATLAGLTLVHALVDLFAAAVQPLWPDFQRSLGLGDAGIQGAYLAWSFATSFSQLAFGLWGDRARDRLWIWVGPALGIIGVAGLGLAGSLPTLIACLIVGGLGVAAFHPEAASIAGSCLPNDRSRAMSIFTVGGFLGQALGPYYCGQLTTRFGQQSLLFSLLWALPLLGVLALVQGRARGRVHTESGASRPPLRVLLQGRRRSMALLLTIASLRVVPGLGVPLAVAYAIKAQGGTNSDIGSVQSMFFVGVGLGSLLCAIALGPRHERLVLWALPLVLASVLAACPFATRRELPLAVGACGWLLGMVSPVLIGYGQRLLPEGQRIASAVTMGVAWGFGAIVVAALMASLNHLGRPILAFPAFAVAVATSSLLCFALPRNPHSATVA